MKISVADLEEFGYKPSNDAQVRRSALARAVRSGSNSYKGIYNTLSSRLSRAEKSWRENVLRRDRSWLLDRAENRGVDVF